MPKQTLSLDSLKVETFVPAPAHPLQDLMMETFATCSKCISYPDASPCC